MGFFFTGYTVQTVLAFIALVAVLIILNEVTRRSKIASIICYGVLPAIILIGIIAGFISSPSTKTWFGTVKTFSALAGVWGFLIIRYTKAGNTKFANYFPVAILAINIIEAITRDIEVFNTYKTMTVDEAGLTMLGGPWNVMNAIAGVFLLLTLTGWVGIKVSNTKSKDMVWADQLWFWILAYDFWNVAYCYNCISTRAMYSGVSLIVACTIAEFVFKKGVWLQHRAQTLALFGMFSLAFDYSANPMFGIEASMNPKAWTVLSAIALIVNFAVFVYEIYVICKYKRNPLKDEMYSHLKAYDANLKANNL